MKETILSGISLPELDQLLNTAPGHAAAVAGVNQTLAAVIACLAAEKGKKVLLVADNDLKAARASDDVRQLTGGGGCLPGGEIDLTRAAGSLESSWRRLEALAAVAEDKVRILCAGVEAMAQRMGHPEPFRALSLKLKPGDVFPPAELSRRLSRMGYDRVGMVEGKGQFAQRGSILDVYPPALSQGLRIEFFDDEIDGIREFDCISLPAKRCWRRMNIRKRPAGCGRRSAECPERSRARNCCSTACRRCPWMMMTRIFLTGR